MSSENHILVVVDPTRDQHLALDRAIITSKGLSNKPKVSLFVAVDQYSVDKVDGDQSVCVEGDQLQSMLDQFKTNGVEASIVYCWSDKWEPSIVQYATDNDVNLIMVSDHATAERGNRFSEAKWALLRKSSCPVVLVRPNAAGTRSKILVAVNAYATDEKRSALNERIMDIAHRSEDLYDAELHVVCSYPDMMHHPDRAKLLSLTGVDQSRVHEYEGRPEDAVPIVAGEISADMVVLGTMRRKGVKEMMRGDISERIMRKLAMDVIAVN